MERVENYKNIEIYFTEEGKIKCRDKYYGICSRNQFKSNACYIKTDEEGTISFQLTDEQVAIIKRNRNISQEEAEPNYDEDEVTELTDKIIKENAVSKGLTKEVLDKLKVKIFLLEKENANTKKLSDTEMVERIRKLIQQEVDRDDN